ncbi:1-acyl-sn-glycerol-3-phosphate acyltransferase [Ferruginibacter lapsinanis]|uniref:lysophospholipid acyltransferase family protein n=1 Tax=Ferruginibacter lapsinanis TaxID=563172 RepID=UPI001E4CEF79|nr:lysophospholipid acyltransferase family protein [Ferruginibacter lapsinanis]UEG48918.1 1-acyl-sn-glycerol-3-phosphate acyltransferase [Ferruginibacter lapsinanis]
MIKNIFARIWALWGLISFVVTFLIIFIPSMIAYFIPDPKGQSYFIGVSRVWMSVWLRLIGCPVKVKGKEHFKAGHNYVILFNHNALLDVPLSAPYVPGPNKTIAKASFAKVPIFGLFYKKGSVLVDRNNDQSRRRSFDAMKNVMLTGMNMCIYPEGTRNRTKEPLKAFFDGGFKLAIDTKKEIMPCIITGTKEAMPIDKSFYLLPTKLSMTFLPPVSSEQTNTKDLKEKVFEIMKTFYLQKSKL